MSNQALSPAQRRGLYRRLLASVGWLRGHPRIRLGLAGAAVLALVLLLAVGRGRGESVDEAALVAVERGPLTISLNETGAIQAKHNLEIKCEVEGQSTITYIVEEGTQVSKGDLLVELDSGDLEEKLTQQQMSYEDAKAARERAVADLDITQSRNESNIKKAEQGLKFAGMDLDKWRGNAQAEGPQQEASGAGDEPERTEPPTELGNYQELCEMAGLELDGREGELFKERREALSDISLARGQLRQAQTRLKGTKELHAKKYATKEELEADTLMEQRRKAELAVAMLNRQLFEQYDWPRELDTRQSAIEEAQRELDRANSEAKANLAQAQAELLKRETQLELQKKRLDKIQEQVKKTEIRAPKDGMVIYPQLPPWRQQQAMEVGAQVRHRQNLLQLPDLSELIVATKIYESVVSRVKVGQKARIEVAALAQAVGNSEAPVLDGRVIKIPVMPDYEPHWYRGSEQKTFTVDIAILETRKEIVEALKPGLSAEVTIVLATLKDAVYVPVQAVTRDADQTVCYRVNGGEPERVPVTVGLSGKVRAQILAGLNPGDRILMAPPLGAIGGVEALGFPGVGDEGAAGEGEQDTEAEGGGEARAQDSAVEAGSGESPGEEATGGEPPDRSQLTAEQRGRREGGGSGRGRPERPGGRSSGAAGRRRGQE